MSIFESFFEQIREELYRSFTQSDLHFSRIAVSMGITILLSVYIFFIYRANNRNGFYSKAFNITLAGMGIVTGSIVLAMQTSVFVSLGMVGALSIVRFRNVVKNPLDLLFLFWSITTGIINGTGLYEVSILLAAVMTVVIYLLGFVSLPRMPCLLVIQSDDPEIETRLLPVVRQHSRSFRFRSRNRTPSSLDMIIEVRPDSEEKLLSDCAAIPGITSVSLLAHDGEIRG